MARPTKFDRKDVLNNAMQVFWQHGYNETSVRDLAGATDLLPGSLYATFGGKRELFLAALDFYFANTRAMLDEVLSSDAPPLARIEQFFTRLVAEQDSDRRRRGCMLVNTLLENPADDKAIRDRVAEMFGEVEGRFAKILREAQRRGELNTARDPEDLARFLITGIYGLRVYNAMRPRTGSLNSVVANLVGALH